MTARTMSVAPRAGRGDDPSRVTVGLARHLVQAGLVTPEEMDQALLEALTTNQALLRVLVARSPGMQELIESELLRVGRLELGSIEPSPQLLRALPSGMCQRLLAIPVACFGASTTVAVADPFDPHLREEFAYQLGRPVKLVQARLGEMLAALEMLEFLPPAPAEPAAPADQTWPEQRTLGYGRSSTRTSSLPAASIPSEGRLVTRPAASTFEPGEAPIPLVRVSASSGPQPVPTSEQVSPEPIEAMLDQLARATAPSEVATGMVRGLAGLAQVRLVFSVTGGRLVLRAADLGPAPAEDPARVGVDFAAEGVLMRALETGYYFGLLRDLPEPLRRLLPQQEAEAYLVRVDVSGRSALLVMLIGLPDPWSATQRADRLARAAGAALERILLARKSGH